MAKSKGELITVLNPAASGKYAERVPLSRRLDTLEGKTLYLLDINWGGPEAAYSVFEQMQGWFAEHIPSVKVVIKRKKGSYMVPDDATWKEVKDGGFKLVKEPWDAIWGQRYAVVQDPDGYQIDLYAEL